MEKHDQLQQATTLSPFLEAVAEQLQLSGDAEAVAHKRVDGIRANEVVTREVASWEGISARDHVMGGVEFRVGRHNLGHLHHPPGDVATADLEFPKAFRDELVASGRARNHVTDKRGETGWVTVPMATVTEVAFAIELFLQRYEQALEEG